MAQAKATTDHDTIRHWVEERGGRPARVVGTGDGDPGLLRIDYPESPQEDLEPITWNEFFEKFEEKHLAFLYQDRTESGETSRFSKLVDRESMEAGG